jgi:hypothetical protein
MRKIPWRTFRRVLAHRIEIVWWAQAYTQRFPDAKPVTVARAAARRYNSPVALAAKILGRAHGFSMTGHPCR